MKTSVNLKMLIIISAAMIITVLSFSLGYFKAKMDFQKYSDSYTVSVEKIAESTAPEEEITIPGEHFVSRSLPPPSHTPVPFTIISLQRRLLSVP